MFLNLLNPNIATIHFENTRLIQNHSFKTIVAVNDDPQLKQEWQNNIQGVDFALTNLLGASKLLSLDLVINSQTWNEFEIALFLNQKAIIDKTKVKKNTTIDPTQAEIDFSKLKRLDLFLYCKSSPERVLAKYTISVTNLPKTKLQITNLYQHNSFLLPYYTTINFVKEQSQIEQSYTKLKVIWNELSSYQATTKIATFEVAKYPRHKLIHTKQKDFSAQLSFGAFNFTLAPFIKTKLDLELRDVSENPQQKEIWEAHLNHNFILNQARDNLVLDLDNSVIRGLMLPSNYKKNITSTLEVASDYFNLVLVRNFISPSNSILSSNIVIKPKRLMIAEIPPKPLAYYRFVFDLAHFNELIVKQNWEFAWFLKKEQFELVNDIET